MRDDIYIYTHVRCSDNEIGNLHGQHKNEQEKNAIQAKFPVEQARDGVQVADDLEYDQLEHDAR